MREKKRENELIRKAKQTDQLRESNIRRISFVNFDCLKRTLS